MLCERNEMHSKRNTDTEKRYLQEVNGFVRWYRRNYATALSVHALTAEVLDRYFTWCRSRVSASTLRRKRSALHWFLKDGRRTESR